MTLYKTTIVEVGSDAAMFKEENMMILFGKEAPAELADYAYIIDVTPLAAAIEVGMTLSFNSSEYAITAVGNVVDKNLTNLGHITLKFDGSTEAELPGTLYLEMKDLPEAAVGTTITIK